MVVKRMRSIQIVVPEEECRISIHLEARSRIVGNDVCAEHPLPLSVFDANPNHVVWVDEIRLLRVLQERHLAVSQCQDRFRELALNAWQEGFVLLFKIGDRVRLADEGIVAVFQDVMDGPVSASCQNILTRSELQNHRVSIALSWVGMVWLASPWWEKGA